MADESPIDPVPPSVQQVLDLFEDALSEVTFPDIDRERLGTLAESVREQAAEVQRLREALDAARREQEERQQALLDAARKGISYARVFADGDADLTARLDDLALAREGRKRKKSRRRRPAAKEAPPAETEGGERTHGRVVAELPLVRTG
ncbi:MAG: hypothetical protein ACQEXJ_01360 [Myxococcota bacterium]